MNKKQQKTAYILNLIIFALEVFAVGWMFSGISGTAVLSASRLGALRYFTVDSNILMGIAALVFALEMRRVMRGEKKEISRGVYVLQLAGVTGVLLTMLVTIFFLAPTMGRIYGMGILFAYSNFFLHLANPILSVITFVCFEKTKVLTFRDTFAGIIPLVLYTVYYTAEALMHMENGVIQPGYDWYGFFAFGPYSMFITIPLIIVITWLISFCLWKLNRRSA